MNDSGGGVEGGTPPGRERGQSEGESSHVGVKYGTGESTPAHHPLLSLAHLHPALPPLLASNDVMTSFVLVKILQREQSGQGGYLPPCSSCCDTMQGRKLLCINFPKRGSTMAYTFWCYITVTLLAHRPRV